MRHADKTARLSRTGVRQAMGLFAALAVVFVALAMPNRIETLKDPWFLAIPLEYPVLLLVLVLAPTSLRLAARLAAGAMLVALVILKAADMAVYFAFARPFNPLVDVTVIPTALETLAGTNGLWTVVGAVLGLAALLGALCSALYWALRAIQNLAPRRGIGVASTAGLIIAVMTPIGHADATFFLRDHATRGAESLRAADEFRAALDQDEFHTIRPDRRLAGLAGTDVILIFVESYGRSTLDDPAYAPTIRERLRQFGETLSAAGFSARSAWLTSSTYGGESYLAHSSVLSGLWVDNQNRYADLMTSRRRTLIDDFRDGGWRTVAVLPQITRAWPEGAFFGYDQVYDSTNLGYEGRPFTYMTMPDQFTLASFHAKELAAPNRPPVMAEIALISSHHPWTPIPKFVPWDQVGDGTVFNTARTTETVDEAWSTPERIRQNYVMTVDYTLETLMSFIATFGGDDMVFIVMGDHQPPAFMARSDARAVPVHIMARDPTRLAVLGDGWAEGMTPTTDSPIAPMSSMRARIINAFARPAPTNPTLATAP
ncbi:MAG: hypothetical protein SFV19_09245 [Rhodospirillaceae bacterium]|nr:hypothetical protein [Rhodospirillaceae bacterium]